MEHRKFSNTDLTVSTIGLGCYGMSGAYGPADDTESIATIRCALDLGINLLDTSASYGKGHNHRLIGEAIRGRRHEVVFDSRETGEPSRPFVLLKAFPPAEASGPSRPAPSLPRPASDAHRRSDNHAHRRHGRKFRQ